MSVPPTRSNASQLIRSVPYQPNNNSVLDAVASATPSGAGTKAGPAAKKDGAYVVACRVGGYEERNVSSADCKAKGGVEVMTPEIPVVASDKTTQKH